MRLASSSEALVWRATTTRRLVLPTCFLPSTSSRGHGFLLHPSSSSDSLRRTVHHASRPPFSSPPHRQERKQSSRSTASRSPLSMQVHSSGTEASGGVAPMTEAERRWFRSVKQLAGEEQWARVFALLEEAQHQPHSQRKPDLFFFGSLMTECLRQRDVETAFRLVDAVRARGLKMDQTLFSLLVRCCGAAGQLRRALAFLEDETRPHIMLPLGAMSYRTLLHCCVKSKEYAMVPRLWQRMQSDNVRPSTACYNAFMEACVRQGDTRQALALLGKMKENRVKPDVATYEALIKGLIDNAETEEAIQMLANAKADGVEPTSSMFTAILSNLSSANVPFESQDRERLVKALKKIVKRCANTTALVHAFNRVLHQTGQNREVNAMEDLFQLMTQDIKLQPDVITYTTLAQGYHDSVDAIDKVKALLERMDEEAVPLDGKLFTSLINTCSSRRGGLTMALELKERMEAAGLAPNHFTYGALMKACIKGGDLDRAYDLFHEMQEEHELKPNLEIYALLLDGHSVLFNKEQESGTEAEEGAQEQGDGKGKGDKLRRRKEPPMREEWRLMQKMQEDGLRPNLLVCNALLSACVRKRCWSQLARVLDLFSDETGVQPDMITRNLLRSAVRSLAEGQRWHLLHMLQEDYPTLIFSKTSQKRTTKEAGEEAKEEDEEEEHEDEERRTRGSENDTFSNRRQSRGGNASKKTARNKRPHIIRWRWQDK
ncbi:hypothetical protein QOT17_010982 [Balamuthia mandrillaris]